MMQRKIEELEALVQGVSSEDVVGQVEILTEVQNVLDNVIPIITMQAQIEALKAENEALKMENEELKEAGNVTPVVSQA
ncbi:MAG: hypothetical protein GY799_00485 [Desulfobulbaceae bacterium]|nr:hypothetical protein [Desulfobulbaceae bacterium]